MSIDERTTHAEHDEEGALILPFYAVCDESASMSGEPIDAINTALSELHQEIRYQPVVAEKARFSLIGFSTSAHVILPISDLSKVDTMDGVSADGSTSYGSAFTLLRQTIEQDVNMLKADGCKVYRPAVFFMSDGQPTDSDWEKALAALVDESFPYRPNIVAFGVAGADASIIGKVATLKAFMMDQGTHPAVALREYAKTLTNSIVMSGSQGGTDMTLLLPPTPEGFTEIPVDQL